MTRNSSPCWSTWSTSTQMQTQAQQQTQQTQQQQRRRCGSFATPTTMHLQNRHRIVASIGSQNDPRHMQNDPRHMQNGPRHTHGPGEVRGGTDGMGGGIRDVVSDADDWTRASMQNIDKTLQIKQTATKSTSRGPDIREAVSADHHLTGSSDDASVADASVADAFVADASVAANDAELDPATRAKVDSISKTSELLRFALSTVGIYLASPLMSLIDTSAVGTCSSNICLAALGPASILCDYAYYLNTWIGVAMTNLHARSVAERDKKSAKDVINTGIKLSVASGLFITVFVSALAAPMVKAYTGAVAEQLLPHAVEYMRIRALGFPAALVTMASQAALLGARNSQVPLLAVAIATLLNFFGDYFFVNKWGWGIGGAAWATVISQYAGMFAILPLQQRAFRKLRQTWPETTKNEAKITASSASSSSSASSAASSSSSSSETGSSVDSAVFKAAVSKDVSKRSALKDFLSFVVPVGSTIIGKLVLYLTLTHVAASFGVTPLAAHQVSLSLFYSLTPFCDTIGNTVQAFLPALKAYGIKAQAAFMSKMTMFGTIAGLSVASVAGIVSTLFPYVFTRDVEVQRAIGRLAPLTTSSLLGHGMLLAAEGWMLSSDQKRDKEFLGNTYAAMMVVVPLAMAAVKHTGGGVQALWKVFAMFQLSRLIIMRTRLHFRLKEEMKQAGFDDDPARSGQQRINVLEQKQTKHSAVPNPA